MENNIPSNLHAVAADTSGVAATYTRLLDRTCVWPRVYKCVPTLKTPLTEKLPAVIEQFPVVDSNHFLCTPSYSSRLCGSLIHRCRVINQLLFLPLPPASPPTVIRIQT